MMRFASLALVCFLFGCSTQHAPSVNSVLDRAAGLCDQGDFAGAATVLQAEITAPGLSMAQREKVAQAMEMLNRVKLDYTLTQDQLFEKLSANVKGLTRNEFDQWVAEGRFDGRMVDGQKKFVGVSISNLFFRDSALNNRRVGGRDESSEQHGRLAICEEIEAAAKLQGTPYVMPHHFLCTMTLTPKENAVQPGEMLRAWLPLPRQYPYQTDFKLIDSSPRGCELRPENSLIRSAYFQETVPAAGPTPFSVTYSYVRSGVYFDLDPAQVRTPNLKDPRLKKYVLEGPHVVFSRKIKALANQIAGAENNPLLEARGFYNWIGHNIKYSFAREYSTLTNLSDYCYANGYGDCGQEGMLFITLCRSRGIPARWQSGWDLFPGFKDLHDWTEIYLEPYGWVPVDPWAGLYADSYCPTLTTAQRDELHNFYFGGLDYYRMAANGDHSQSLFPVKHSLRSDDVDFQRGEMEANGTNLYFDKYSYALDVKEVK